MYLDVSKAFLTPSAKIPFTHTEQIPPQPILGDTLNFSENALFTGEFSMSGEMLLLDGVFTAKATGQCALCLEDVTWDISVPFHEVYHHVNVLTDELVDDLESLAFEGNKVDLSHMALTLAMLALPIRFECMDGCPTQANNINSHAYQKESSVQNPFSALQQLLTKDQEV